MPKKKMHQNRDDFCTFHEIKKNVEKSATFDQVKDQSCIREYHNEN